MILAGRPSDHTRSRLEILDPQRLDDPNPAEGLSLSQKACVSVAQAPSHHGDYLPQHSDSRRASGLGRNPGICGETAMRCPFQRGTPRFLVLGSVLYLAACDLGQTTTPEGSSDGGG